MDDTPAKNAPGDNINKLDLSALEAFQFGTQWDNSGESKRAPGDRSHEARGRDSRESTGPRRDRRPPRREGPRGDAGPPGGPSDRPQERSFRGGEGGPAGGEARGGGGRPFRERRDDRGGGGRFGGPRGDFAGQRRPAGPPRPYQSADFELTFYPDDHGFNALVKAMRASNRTYELFEIARLILGKLERCVVVFHRKPVEGGQTPPLFIAVPDGLPFPTEEEAVAHALDAGLTQFFDTETVEVEPPKGTFQFVNRCPITKDLLGPPNYHRYPQILQNHYNTRGINMPFERYKASIEVVRDEETVKTWLESMKSTTRYTFKGESAEGPTTFDNVDDARSFLLRACRDKVVRSADTIRVPAKIVEAAGRTEAARAMHGMLEAQRRFPLDTANALRGRLRRENFHIFKRGSKGVTFVCSVRRKFRQPGQVFSDSINQLIEFLEKHPLLPVGELAPGLLGITPPSSPTPPQDAPANTEPPPQTAGEETQAVTSTQDAASELTPEQKIALSRLALDLRWLVSEGYVAEYSDGRLFAHPIMAPEQAALEDAGHGHSRGHADKREDSETREHVGGHKDAGSHEHPETREHVAPHEDDVSRESPATSESGPAPASQETEPSATSQPEAEAPPAQSAPAEPEASLENPEAAPATPEEPAPATPEASGTPSEAVTSPEPKEAQNASDDVPTEEAAKSRSQGEG